MIKQEDSYRNSASVIAELWGMNKHFDRIKDETIKWIHVFKFDFVKEKDLS